jgi:hypothetical protein
MTPKEEAELLFKQDRLSGGLPDYEQRARAERTKTARLRMLRLAREAALAHESEQTAGTAKTRTQHMS